MMNSAFTRREFLTTTGAGALTAAAALSLGPFVAGPSRARAAEPEHRSGKYPYGKAEHCIMLWLGGGAAQIDTFDPKKRGDPKKKTPGSAYDAIDTAVPGVQVTEHLPRCAKVLDRFVLMRSVHHDVIDEHAAAVNRMHTGRPTSGTVVYPSIGSIIAHERGAAAEGVPAYVVVGYPNITRGPGFLGATAGYLYLVDTESGPAGLVRPDDITGKRQSRREALLAKMREDYLARNPQQQTLADYDQNVAQSLRLAGPQFMNVFDLKSESASLRESYGGEFGQRCLLARRLVQSGVRFVEVAHNLNFVNGTGWDTHNQGQLNQHVLIDELDRALATLVVDLEQHKMLDKTLIVVGTEFGRPPEFDGGGGRGHQCAAFTIAFAGGGLNTGRAIGQTDELSKKIAERPVSVPDLFATIHCTLGIDPSKHLYDGDRPVPITDLGEPVRELFA